MPGQLQLRIVTPERPIFRGAVDAVVVPAHDGEIGILPRHARLLAALGVGELRASTGTSVQRFFVEGGFVQVSADRVTVLCDRGAPLADLDPRAVRAEADAAAQGHSPDAARLRQRATVLERVAHRSSAGTTAH